MRKRMSLLCVLGLLVAGCLQGCASTKTGEYESFFGLRLTWGHKTDAQKNDGKATTTEDPAPLRHIWEASTATP